MQRSSVLLPDPEGPITHTTSDGCTTRLIPARTSRPLNLFTRFRTTIGGTGLVELPFSATVCASDSGMMDSTFYSDPKPRNGFDQNPIKRRDEKVWLDDGKG